MHARASINTTMTPRPPCLIRGGASAARLARPLWCRPATDAARRRTAAAARTRATSTTSPSPSSVAELDALAQALLALRAKGDPSDAQDAAVGAAASTLEQRALELGASLYDRSLVSGVFQGHTLTGRNVKATSGAMPLGALSFGSYASTAGTLVKIIGGGDAPSRILRGGERFAVGPDAYVLSTAFEVVALGGEGGEAASPPARPLKGISHAVARGSWSDDPAHPHRMDLQFAAMVLEPLLASPGGGDLSDWLASFGAPVNPSMDAASGRLVVPLSADKAPKGWIDHLLATPTHTLIRGNFGSVSLLVRCSPGEE